MTGRRLPHADRYALKHGQRGQALVEFALAATVSMLLVLGVLEFGRALFTYDLVVNAARLGSRYAMVHGSACTGCQQSSAQIQTWLQGQSAGINASQLTVTTTWPGTLACSGSQAPGCPVNVAVSYPFSFFAFSWGSFNMTSSSQMTISQ